MNDRLMILGLCLVLSLQWGCSPRDETRQSRATVEEYPEVDPSFLASLKWRSIGPHRGGRSAAVAGDPRNPLVFYFGASGGGVWKTHNAGLYWENVSDGFFNTAPVGAIAVSESDPNVIYAGTGESCPRPDVAPGDGVYRSNDGGKTWTHVGLKETRHIAKIRIHPRDPNRVYVAAMGHLFGQNPERGVYRSTDGGKTWELVLFKSEKAGAVDISIDPANPNILYAAIYQFIRQPWDEISGGPDSGLYKSTDGGDTWADLVSGDPVLPQGIKGKIGVAVSPARPSRVWALIEAVDGALFRSDDRGASWQKITDQRDLRRSASSYHHVIPHPQDPETLYVLSYEFWKSTDGGQTFKSFPMPHGDHHALWIDPRDPRRMIEGSDGGATVTRDGGTSWSSHYTQPTSALFHLTTDNQFPYRVYGTQNDNSAISVPSRTNEPAIAWKQSYPVGSAESGHIVVRPDDPNIVFVGSIGSSPGGGGNLLRYDHRTGQARLITVWPEDQYGGPPKDAKYRFHFTYPVVLSPHDPDVLYVAANKIFRTTNQGTSWEAISPDLTRNDISKMQNITGGPITTLGFSSAYSSVIYSLAESPHKRGELWAGGDDSLIHYSPDGGQTWNDVSPEDLPEWTTISILEVSPHNQGTVYFAGHRYKLADHRTYFYKTTDYGKTWQRITNGIRENDFARVIREDPVRPGLLYAGTETGVYVSFDAGASWLPLQRNLPPVPVHDMVVKENDLVTATHGRSFWILDNLTPLRQITSQVTQAPVHLFEVPPTYRLLPIGTPVLRFRPGIQYGRVSGGMVAFKDHQKPNGEITRTFLDAGENPPEGVMVTYYLKQKPSDDLTLTFLDEKGQTIKSFSSSASDDGAKTAPAESGANLFVWDMRYPNAREVPPGAALSRSEYPTALAPVAPPGSYKVQLVVGGKTYEQGFEIRKDPRVPATEEDLIAQFELMIQIRDKLSETTDAVYRIREAREQIEEREGAAGGEVSEAAAERIKELLDIEGKLTRLVGPNPMALPPKALHNKLAALTAVVSSTDMAPTRQSYEVFEDLSARVAVQLKRSEEIVDSNLTDLLGSKTGELATVR